MILIGLNLLALGGAGGLMYYMRVVFKRPAITEKSERARLEQPKPKAGAHGGDAGEQPGTIHMDLLTINIPGPELKDANEEPQLHYLNVAFSLDLRDSRRQAEIERVKPQLIDQFIALMGKKRLDELNSVQGRYLIRNELIEMTNKLLEEPLVVNAYFTQFMVQ